MQDATRDWLVRVRCNGGNEGSRKFAVAAPSKELAEAAVLAYLAKQSPGINETHTAEAAPNGAFINHCH